MSDMQAIVALAKRTGFVFPSSDIYGGLNGFYDYGPMGVSLKENIRRQWWSAMVENPPKGPDGRRLHIVGIDSSVILNPQVWKASGHVDGFHDELSDCVETKKRYRADHLLCYELVSATSDEAYFVSVLSGDDSAERLPGRVKLAAKLFGFERSVFEIRSEPVSFTDIFGESRERVLAPDATAFGTLTPPRSFNLMFETSVGALSGSDSLAYLRPETAQGIFINFKNVVTSSRTKVPFGIAQVGKAFRNEITPRNFIFRSREFEQMELEWFCAPAESQMWFEYWCEQRSNWWKDLGIRPENLILRPHSPSELAHYSTGCHDVEYRFPFAKGEFGELEGIANRSDYDLNQHSRASKVKLEYADQVNGGTFVPHVIEPSAGLTRATLAVLCDAYRFDPSRPSTEFLALPPALAPIKAGLFPLTTKNGIPEYASKLAEYLQRHFQIRYDDKQSIGKRYARMDEVGTPFCITVDDNSLVDNTVTIRSRDTGEQERISSDKVDLYLQHKISPNAVSLGSFRLS